MDIIVNVITSIIFSIIDLYLILMYIKEKSNISFEKQRYIFLSFMFLLIANCRIDSNFLFSSLLYILSISILIYNPYFTILKIKSIIVLTVLRFISTTLSIPLCEWIFDIPFSLIQINKYYLYFIFIELFCRYLMLAFTLIIVRKQKKENIHKFRLFKVTSILTSIYFCINIIIYNDKLFYFKNIGHTFLLTIFIYNAMLIFFDYYQIKHETIEHELLIINKNIINEKDYMKKYIESQDILKDMRHDLKNNYTIISGYLYNGDIQSAQNYINKLINKVQETSSIEHLGHPCIDSIINDKINIMIKKNIIYEETISPIYVGNICMEDLALLIGLALDNAIEATDKIKNNKKINLSIKSKEKFIILNISNTIQKGINPNFYKTCKADKINHGFGVKKIRYFTNLYNGEMKYSVEENLVKLRVTLLTE